MNEVRINAKKLGVAVSGALLLGSTLLGAVGATTDVNKDFFISPDTGEPQCLIVVGSSAAAEDVVSASWISAQIGSMAYYTEYVQNEQLYTLTYYEEEEVDNYLYGALYSANDNFDDFRFYNFVDAGWLGFDVMSGVFLPMLPTLTTPATEVGPASWVVLPYDSTPWWDYDVYVDHNTDYACTAEIWVDTGCSYESVTADFSVRDVSCSQEMCIQCYAACDQKGLWQLNLEGTPAESWSALGVPTPSGSAGSFYWIGDMESLYAIQRAVVEDALIGDQWDGETPEWSAFPIVALEDCQTYPNVYPRQYWGVPSWNEEYCDPIGGVQYRTIVYGIDDLEPITWWAIIGPDSEAYNICEPIYPEEINLYCDTCEVYFLGQTFDALSFGTNEDGVDYMFYGTPKWYIEEKLRVGESKDYGGYTLTINDLGIYENKIFSTITTPSGSTHDYVSVIDTYTSQVPSDGEGDCDNWENQTIAFKEDTCSSEEVVFAVKFVKTMIGASGNYIVEYHAYNLLDYGCLTERIYPGPCDTVTDELYMPYVVSSCGGQELEWYLDIFPNNGIQTVDLDNDEDLWWEGNPNFDATDSLRIYSNTLPLEALVGDGMKFATEAAAANALDDYYYTLKDFVPATPSANNVFVAPDDSLEGYTREFDFIVPEVHPALELWLATPVELAGMCTDALTICLDDLEGNNYLTIEVKDTIHTDYQIDGSVKVIKKEMLAPTAVVHYVNIDVTKLVALDTEIEADPALKSMYNLVLVGGPVANVIVQELVDLGFTTYEEWDTSPGEYQVFEDVYALGKDVLVVAGMDRTATAKAALDLIAEM